MYILKRNSRPKLTLTEIRHVVVETIKAKAWGEFELGDHFINDIGLDSLDRYEVIMDIEKALKIKPLNELELENIYTPAELIKFISDNYES